jgi:hypothetical protein
MWDTRVIFKVNNHPLGENSPNRVTQPAVKKEAICKTLH